VGRCVEGNLQRVHARRLHGVVAADRIQLTARVLPGRRLRDWRTRRVRALRQRQGASRSDCSPRRDHVHRQPAAGLAGRHVRRGVRARFLRRRLGSERRDGHDHEGGQPRVRAAGDATVLADPHRRDHPRRRDGSDDGRRLPADRRRRLARRRDCEESRPRRRLQLDLGDRALADRSSTTSAPTCANAVGNG
jgi:hypothetical protein